MSPVFVTRIAYELHEIRVFLTITYEAHLSKLSFWYDFQFFSRDKNRIYPIQTIVKIYQNVPQLKENSQY